MDFDDGSAVTDQVLYANGRSIRTIFQRNILESVSFANGELYEKDSIAVDI
jgi:hypothetical protein